MTTPREPRPPQVVVDWVRRFAGTDTRSATALEGGMTALNAALSTSAGRGDPGGGSRRDSAWALLAADALLTWAVEDAAEAPDPGATLEALLRRVQEAAPAEPGPRPPPS